MNVTNRQQRQKTNVDKARTVVALLKPISSRPPAVSPNPANVASARGETPNGGARKARGELVGLGAQRPQNRGPRVTPARPRAPRSSLRSLASLPKVVFKPDENLDVPIAEFHPTHGSFEHTAVERGMRNGNVLVRGSEYLFPVVAGGAAAGTWPSGSVLCSFPIHPLFLGGSRLRLEAMQYDLFRWIKFAVEYVPTCAATTDGGLVAGCYLDTGRPVVTGEAALRSMYAREGTGTSPVWKSFVSHLTRSQLKWYSTSFDDSDISTAIPGMFELHNNTPVTLPSPQFGLLWVHYEIEFEVPAVLDPAPTMVGSRRDSVAALPARGAGVSAYIPAANITNMFIDLNVGYIYQFHISGAPAGTTSVLLNPQTGADFTLAAGGIVWGRYGGSANPGYFLFSSLADALGSSNEDALLIQTAWPGTETLYFCAAYAHPLTN